MEDSIKIAGQEGRAARDSSKGGSKLSSKVLIEMFEEDRVLRGRWNIKADKAENLLVRVVEVKNFKLTLKEVRNAGFFSVGEVIETMVNNNSNTCPCR